MKYLFTIIAMLCYFGTVASQNFKNLRPQDYPIGEELPIYTEQINLGYGVQGKDVDVVIEYPEFQKLSSVEKKLIEKYQHNIPEKITPIIQHGMEKKCGVIEVGILPFIKKYGVLMRITSVRVSTHLKTQKLFAQTSSIQTSQRYNDNSVLSTGKWVKIKVEKEGVYQLTPSLIKQWGFSDINKIKIYGYGGRILPQLIDFNETNAPIDDLVEVAQYKENDRILFFAEGCVRFKWQTDKKEWIHENNHYANGSYYFVTEGESPKILQLKESDATGTEISIINHHALYDSDAYAWFEGGRQFHDTYNFAKGNSKTYSIQTPSAAEGVAKINFTFSASSVAGATTVETTCKDKTVRSSIRACLANESAVEIKKSFNVNDISDVTDVKFVTTSQRNARLNHILITYPRVLSANDEPFSFTPNPSIAEKAILKVANATAQTQLWSIDSYNNIYQIATQLDGTNLSAQIDNTQERFVIVNPTKTFPAPSFVEEVANQNLHADADLDMIIIVPASGIFDEQAERLATAHSTHNSLSVKVVRQNWIFNEFSSGTPDATAIRRYLKMLYDRATNEESLPKYVLFFGDCYYDNRMILEQNQNKSPKNYLLSYEDNDNYQNSVVTSIGDLLSYPTDDYFGLLDDGEGTSAKTEKVDIAIGRFVCHTEQHAQILVDKTISYLENKNVGNWKNKIVAIGDAKDKNTHMVDAERVVTNIQNITQNSFNIKRIYPDLYTRQVTGVGYRFPKAKEILTEDIKRGALIFNYSGHGSPAQISHAFIFEADDWQTTQSKALPLWILASCEILPYDQDKSDFARQALFHSNGGGVAFMCASRAVYASENSYLNTAYTEFLLTPNDDGSYNTIGEALRLAKNQLITLGKDRSINKLKYILAGDPALSLQFPKQSIRLDSINGKSITSESMIQLKAGSIATFSGSTESDFDGVITATLYDIIEKHVCKNNDGSAEEPFTYQERTKIIYEGSDSVRGGKFSFKVPIPMDINYSNDCGRLSLYAVSNDHKIEARGFNESFYMNGTTTEMNQNDSIGPNTFIYLDYPEFPNGGMTNSSPMFVALLNDSSGINATGISLGHDIELCIDNDINNVLVLNDYFNYDFGSYQQGRIEYQLKDLQPGMHTLNFRVWDLNNNPSNQTLNFVVGTERLTNRPFYATMNPATTTTTFVANLSDQHVGGTATFEVYSLLGQKLWNNSQTITSNTITKAWNLTTSSGIPLEKGVYLYRMIIESSVGVEEYDAERIIIL